MFLGNKARPARKADNLSAICKPIVNKMWDPRHLTIPIDLHGSDYRLNTSTSQIIMWARRRFYDSG
jgi:hypothetical protein